MMTQACKINFLSFDWADLQLLVKHINLKLLILYLYTYLSKLHKQLSEFELKDKISNRFSSYFLETS